MDSEDRNGRSKNLVTYSGLTYGNESSQHVFHSKVTEMTGSTDHFDTKHQIIEEKRSINPFEICPEVGENDSSKLLGTHTAVSDSSHSTSSLEELQVDTVRSLRSFTQPASKGDEINVSNSYSSKSKVPDKWSPDPTSTSQVSQVAHESMIHDVLQTQSPPIQVMNRSGEYDPLRIPLSIFERSKSSTKEEWSGASNESLFSIPIGNNSLSRDQFKSGELPKSDEFIVFNTSLSIPEVRTDKDGEEFEKSGESVQMVSNVTKETTVDHRSLEKAPAANVLRNPSQISDNSNDSTHSFTFPINKKKKRKCAWVPFCCCRKKCKGKKCAWPSCYCSNCSCTFCHCSLPSCYRSNCSWAFCYRWNCSLKRWCCHSSTILPNSIKSVSVKPEVNEKQHPQKLQPSEVSSNSSSVCCWFSCFSCRPRCCSEVSSKSSSFCCWFSCFSRRPHCCSCNCCRRRRCCYC